MTSPLVNFLSYNSTGMNSIKAAWISDLLQVTNSHFIGIQEHLKRNKTVDKFFRDQFSDYNTYVVPAHRDQGQDSGRAKGGLAALSSRNLDIQCHRIRTNSFRTLDMRSLFYTMSGTDKLANIIPVINYPTLSMQPFNYTW